MAGIGATVFLNGVLWCLTVSLRWLPIPCIPSVRHRYVYHEGSLEVKLIPLSLGYAGYYGMSMIAGSYAVLFASLACHAAQFGFLVFFENPRT